MRSSGKKPAVLKSIFIAALVLALISTAGCNFEGTTENGFVFYSFPGSAGVANSYVVANGGKAAVVDPAAPDKIIGTLKEKKLVPELIILTHGHFDHISGIGALKSEYPGIKVLIHPADMDKLADPVKNLATLFGTSVAVRTEALPLKDGARIKLGKTTLSVTATPGHSPGSVVLQAGHTLFSGDTLFRGGVGRTDFPDSRPEDLTASLKKLSALPDNIEILPGHGELTTMGDEKQNNPYLK